VTEGLDIATARLEMKQLLQSLGYQPEAGQAGTLKDLSSDARINLQLRQNLDAAFGFGQYLQGQDEAVLDQWPAQELFRAEERKEPRDWPTRWMQAGGQIFEGGRMIALKNDPIWTEISAFGTPYPPFDFGSGMWVRDVDRETAESLGLLSPGQVVTPGVEDFNASLEASVKDIDPDLAASLKESFGDQIEIESGTARWTGRTPVTPPPTPPIVPPPVTPPPIVPPPIEPPAVPPAPVPTPPPASKLTVPDVSDLAERYEQAAPSEQVRITEEARERIAIPSEERAGFNLQMEARLASTRRVAQAGADIVARYTAPELVENTNIVVRHLDRGARAYHLNGTIHLNESRGESTAAHEVMHAVEIQNPAVLKASAEFLLKRGAGESPKLLRELTGVRSYGNEEVALEDDWVKRKGSVYAGKVYQALRGQLTAQSIRATEVLTMGIERLHADPLEFYLRDREWYDFVVKTLRGL
jgi:hypothetical protein